jgi:hypothetical protein
LERTPSQLRLDLRACTYDGALYMLMVGLAQEYFAKFAREIGMGDAQIGWLEPIPMLLATLAQLASVFLVLKVGSYQRVVWIAAAFQAFLLFPIAGLALWASGHPDANRLAADGTVGLTLFGIISLYYMGAQMGSSPWMAMVGLAIPSRVMPRYMGRRTLVIHVAYLTGLLGAGFALHPAESTADVLRTLAHMFMLAGVARAGSAWYLSRYSQHGYEPPIVVPPAEIVRRVASGNDGRALAFLVAMQAAMWIGFPFFRPYMLNQLGGETGTPGGGGRDHERFVYPGLLGAFILGKMLAPELAGRLIADRGLLRMTWIASLAVVPVPLFWLVSDHLAVLLIAQLLAGAALGSFELCSILLQIHHVPTRERTSVLATFGLCVYAAGFAGATLGGWLLGASPSRSEYVMIFIASFGARLATLGLLARVTEPGPEPVVQPPILIPSEGGT